MSNLLECISLFRKTKKTVGSGGLSPDTTGGLTTPQDPLLAGKAKILPRLTVSAPMERRSMFFLSIFFRKLAPMLTTDKF